MLLRCYSWLPGKKPIVSSWSHVRLKDLKKQTPFHLQMRAPPVAGRPRDLQRGKQLGAWLHGTVSLAIGATANSSLAKFFQDRTMGGMGTASPSVRGSGVMRSTSGYPEPSEAEEESTVPLSTREARDVFAELTHLPKRPEAATLALAHKTLMEMGVLSNEAGHTRAALKAFEAAFRLSPDDGVALLSATNMRFKLGQVAVAKDLYTWLLHQSGRISLPPHAAAMAVRKLKAIQDGTAGQSMRSTMTASLSSTSGPWSK